MPSRSDRLLTHISTSQTQNTSIAAAEHTADDISQGARTDLGLVTENKEQQASYDSFSALK